MMPNNINTNNANEILSALNKERGWIQPSISQSYISVSNEKIINGIYAATADEKIVISIESNQSWFWTHSWQKLEAEADKDIAEGHFTSHKNMDDFIADLDN